MVETGQANRPTHLRKDDTPPAPEPQKRPDETTSLLPTPVKREHVPQATVTPITADWDDYARRISEIDKRNHQRMRSAGMLNSKGVRR